MSVPDTNTFTLQDVVNELIPFVDTLVGCFAVAIDGEFDPAYKGSKDRQSNFRNYGLGLKWIHLEPYPGCDTGHVWRNANITNPPAGDQAAWDSVHDALTGYGVVTNTDNLIRAAKRGKGGGSYDMFISRTLMSFDMRLVPSSLSILAIKIVSRCTSRQGIDIIGGFYVWYDCTIVTDDYDPAGKFLYPLATKNNEDWIQGDASTVKDIGSANSTEISNINSRKEELFGVMIAHYKDYEDSLPQADHYVWIWRDGTEIGDYIWKPQLRLQYLGVHILDISVTLWKPGVDADGMGLYLVASEGNNWSTLVSSGDTWLIVGVPTTGNGTRWVSIHVTANTGAPRDGSVTFESSSADKVLMVSQAGVPECYGTPDPYAAPYRDQDQFIQVIVYPSTNNWVASFVDTGDGIGWIHFVGGNTGMGDGDFTINVDDNDGVARSCDIKLDSDLAADYFVDVDQDPGGITGGALAIDNQSNSSDSININVTPDTMRTTSIKVDTGDGTTWFTITLGGTGIGDFTLEVELTGTPPTSNKSAQVRIDDNASGIHELVSVNYTYID